MPAKMTEVVKVADEVWIATALLHYKRPAADFTVEEIVESARREAITPTERPAAVCGSLEIPYIRSVSARKLCLFAPIFPPRITA